MQREERVTVKGPVKEQQPDGMSHGGGGGRHAMHMACNFFNDSYSLCPEMWYHSPHFVVWCIVCEQEVWDQGSNLCWSLCFVVEVHQRCSSELFPGKGGASCSTGMVVTFISW